MSATRRPSWRSHATLAIGTLACAAHLLTQVTTTVDHMWHVDGAELPEYWTVDGVAHSFKTSGSAAPVYKRPIPSPGRW